MAEENNTSKEIVFTEEVQNILEGLIEEMGITNYTISISSGSVCGDNYLGVISRTTIEGQRNGKREILNLIVKIAPNNPFYRESVPFSQLFEREIYIYTKVLPAFAYLQSEKEIANPFQSHPKLYRSIMNDMNETLIMEDMKQSKFQLCDRQQPLNCSHVLMVMREYGKFHALSFALRDQKPDVFDELYKNTPEIFLNNYPKPKDLDTVTKIDGKRALRTLDPVKDKVAYEKFQAFSLKMVDIVKMIVKAEPAGNHAVIGHGDGWNNNLFFKYNNSSEPFSPSELCMIDWQLSRAGSPVLDITHFLFTCTDKPLRDQYYHHLIQEYYHSLSSFLRVLGSDPEILFPYTVLQEHLRKFAIYGLYMAVIMLHVISSDSEEIPDYNNIPDLNKAWEAMNFETKNFNKYCTRMRDVILDFDRLGYDFYNES